MKKNLYNIVLLFLLLCSACKQQAGKQQSSDIDSTSVESKQKQRLIAPLVPGGVTLRDEDFGELVQLKGVNRILDEEGPIFKMSEPEMLIKGNYFLLQNRPMMSYTRLPDGRVQVKKSEEKGLDCFFHWYRLPDFKYICSFGKGGNGPDEFVFPHLVVSGLPAGKAYVYETKSLRMYEADTTGVITPCPFSFKAIKGAAYSSREICAVTSDTICFVDNTSKGKAIFRAVYQNDSLQVKQLYDLAFSKKHRSWSPYIGDFIISPSGDRIVYAYKYFRKILVMDKDAKNVREISFGADEVEAKNDVLTLGPDNVTYYWGISATDDYFFLTYSGRTPIQVSKELDKDDGYIYVEQYDWGGNPIARYELDHWGRVVSDGKHLYQLCYKYDDPLFLYEFPTK